MVWCVVGVRECVCSFVIYLFCFCEMKVHNSPRQQSRRTQSNDTTTNESSSIISYEDMMEIIRDLKEQVKVTLFSYQNQM